MHQKKTAADQRENANETGLGVLENSCWDAWCNRAGCRGPCDSVHFRSSVLRGRADRDTKSGAVSITIRESRFSSQARRPEPRTSATAGLNASINHTQRYAQSIENAKAMLLATCEH